MKAFQKLHGKHVLGKTSSGTSQIFGAKINFSFNSILRCTFWRPLTQSTAAVGSRTVILASPTLLTHNPRCSPGESLLATGAPVLLLETRGAPLLTSGFFQLSHSSRLLFLHETSRHPAWQRGSEELTSFFPLLVVCVLTQAHRSELDSSSRRLIQNLSYTHTGDVNTAGANCHPVQPCSSGQANPPCWLQATAARALRKSVISWKEQQEWFSTWKRSCTFPQRLLGISTPIQLYWKIH